MRKALVSLFIMFIAFTMATAEEGDIFDGPVGTYAIYHDTRFGDDVFIGLCYVGEDTLLVRSMRRRRKTSCSCSFRSLRNEGEGIGLGQEMRVIRGDMQSSRRAQGCCPMLMNCRKPGFR
jgi:hypothetical protein